MRLTASEPLDLGLQFGERRPGLEELPAVPVRILLEPLPTILRHPSGLLGHFSPPLSGGKPCPKAVVVLLEASGAAALGAQVAPESERIREVDGEALAIGPFAVRLRCPLAGSANPARAGAWHLVMLMCDRLLPHRPDNNRTRRN